MVVFLQNFSLLNLLLHLDLLFRAKTIHVYGQERRFSVIDVFNFSSNLGETFLRCLGLKSKVAAIDPELFSIELWRSNYDAISLAENCGQDFQSSQTYKFLSSFLGEDPAMVKYYQARCALYISRLLHQVRLIQILSQTEDIRVVIGHEEFVNLSHSPHLLSQICQFRTLRSRVLAFIKKQIHSLVYRVQWLILPLCRVIFLLPKFRHKRNETRHFKLMMQVHWGAPVVEGEDSNAMKTPKHDFYLYSGLMGAGDILHYYDGSWSFDSDFRQRCDVYMKERGYQWARKDQLCMGPKHVWWLLCVQAKLWFHAVRHGFLLQDAASVQNVSGRALWEICERELDLAHFSWDAIFDRMDYNPRHIVDTIFLNQHGTKTIGLHHCASPYDSPQIAFVHYNYYIALGEIFVRPFKKWWDPKMLIPIGRNNLDWTVQSKADPKLSAEILEKFESTHGKFPLRATIILPGDIYYMFPRRWEEMEKGLRKFIESDLDMAVIVRFKSIQDIKLSRNLSRLWELCKSDPRIIVDQVRLNTYECMSISQIIITPNCSSAINEGIALDLPVFTFDFHGRALLIFGEYGAGFVLQTGQELFDRLECLTKSQGHTNFDFARLKKDANFTADGFNHHRTSQFVGNVARRMENPEKQVGLVEL